ncbi:MAG: thioredoxin fold domain-containing protein [Chitinophagaceae bacterium]
MNRISVLAIGLLSLIHAETKGQFKSGTTIAPFEITLSNGQVFKAANVKKKVPVMLVYFAPDCDHCQHFSKDLLSNAAIIKNKQVIMITYFKVEDLVKFDKEYKLSANPNIKVGTEGTKFIVRKYYNILQFPYIVMYNSNGIEATRFTTDVPFETIRTAILKLK